MLMFVNIHVPSAFFFSHRLTRIFTNVFTTDYTDDTEYFTNEYEWTQIKVTTDYTDLHGIFKPRKTRIKL
jgi:hypothetical protein